MIADLKPFDWVKLKNKLPKEYGHICTLGERLWVYTEHIDRVIPYISPTDIIKLEVYAKSIASEYLRLLRKGAKYVGWTEEKMRETELKEVKEDIIDSLNDFYLPNGKSKHFVQDVIGNPRIIMSYLSSLITFTKSRVYDALLGAYQEQNSYAQITKLFVMNSALRAGLAPTKEHKFPLLKKEEEEKGEEA